MKLRRTLAAGAIAGLFAVAPASAALATEDDGYAAAPNAVSVTGSFVPGGTLVITINFSQIPQGIIDYVQANGIFLQFTTSGLNGGDAANAEIAGTVTSAVKAADGGSTTFSVTLPEEPVTVTGTANSGDQVLDTYSFTVGEAGDGVATDGDTASGEELSSTGFDNPGLAAGAAGLLVVGAGAVFVAARRRA